ncbi:MAG TPA: hypothetical protein VFG45_01085 [Candidatus Nitrosocosmicus sp.]|jgi:hypothetical protein|nr:hypothetical protein [Candidatus Nitrosocosmicus sp.]
MSNTSQITGLENSTYNVIPAGRREAIILYSTADNYIQDAQSDGSNTLLIYEMR